MADELKAFSALRAGVSPGLARFAIIGGGGFLIDTGLTMALLDIIGIFAARLTGFVVAVAFTFLLNRQLSFGQAKVQRARTEAILYLGIQVIGAGLNFFAFLGMATIGPSDRLWILLYLTVSACAGLIWNYAINRVFVYERRATEKGSQ